MVSSVQMKRKFKIMTHQIDQLKEEIATKDQAVIQQHFQVKSLKEEMKSELIATDHVFQYISHLCQAKGSNWARRTVFLRLQTSFWRVKMWR